VGEGAMAVMFVRRAVLEIEDVDRSEGPALPAFEISRSHVDEPGVVRGLIQRHWNHQPFQEGCSSPIHPISREPPSARLAPYFLRGNHHTMGANRTSLWLEHIVLSILFSILGGAAISAQTPRGAQPDLEAALTRGMTVWITDSGGREEKTQIVGVSGGIVTTTAGDDFRRLRTTDVMRVRVRHSDSVLNGALIGAGAALASGLFLCRLTETWENCRDDVGPMFTIGAIGAGAGIGIDALIRGRRTIYEAAPATRLHVAPVVARRGGGLQVSLSF
jgi:hypothetical protein